MPPVWRCTFQCKSHLDKMYLLIRSSLHLLPGRREAEQKTLNENNEKKNRKTANS